MRWLLKIWMLGIRVQASMLDNRKKAHDKKNVHFLFLIIGRSTFYVMPFTDIDIKL